MGFAGDIADRVCFPEDGGIAGESSPEKIFSQPEDPRTRRFPYPATECSEANRSRRNSSGFSMCGEWPQSSMTSSR